jgi:uncharacterized protein YecE (DUF72 family)
MGKAFVGTSGWQYFHWQPKFYPQDLPQKDWLSYYAKYFDTVEVNATFYHQMKPTTFQKWRETVGSDFTFAIKGSRFITHIKRLKDCREAIERFFEAADSLRGLTSEEVRPPQKKNVVLWQLPPRFKVDKERLEGFLQLVHSRSVWRQAFEFRDKSWLTPEIYNILKGGNCALVIQDSLSWPTAEVITTDFVYLRFHGRESLYASCYSDSELDEWAEKMKQWTKEGLDVYAYFNNDAQGYAVQNAKELKKLLTGKYV